MSEAFQYVLDVPPTREGGDTEQRRFTRRLPHLLSTLFRCWETSVITVTGLIAAQRIPSPTRLVLGEIIHHDIAFIVVTAAFCLHFSGAYQPYTFVKRLSTLKALVSAGLGLFCVSYLCHIILDVFSEGLEEFWIYWASTAGTIIIAARIVVHIFMARRVRAGMMRETVAIVGGGSRAERLIDYIREECGHTTEIIGIFDDRDIGRFPARSSRDRRHIPNGTIDELLALGKDKRITRIIVAFPLAAEDRLHQVFKRLKSLSVDILLCPDHIGFSLLNLNVDSVGALPLLKVAETPFSGFSYFAKLAEDKILAVLAIILFGPIMIAAAIAIKLESPGPVLFRQLRYGVDNTPFQVYKFRSMYWHKSDHVGVQQVTRTDNRVTAVGRFLRRHSIDELPQLFNVLEGTMSIVGPRPHAVGMRTANLLCEEIVETYEHRHRVKPGITGWAQVNGSRGPTDTPRQLMRRVELDLFYIENWSVYLDLKIIILTVLKLFRDDMAF